MQKNKFWITTWSLIGLGGLILATTLPFTTRCGNNYVVQFHDYGSNDIKSNVETNIISIDLSRVTEPQFVSYEYIMVESTFAEFYHVTKDGIDYISIHTKLYIATTDEPTKDFSATVRAIQNKKVIGETTRKLKITGQSITNISPIADVSCYNGDTLATYITYDVDDDLKTTLTRYSGEAVNFNNKKINTNYDFSTESVTDNRVSHSLTTFGGMSATTDEIFFSFYGFYDFFGVEIKISLFSTSRVNSNITYHIAPYAEFSLQTFEISMCRGTVCGSLTAYNWGEDHEPSDFSTRNMGSLHSLEYLKTQTNLEQTGFGEVILVINPIKNDEIYTNCQIIAFMYNDVGSKTKVGWTSTDLIFTAKSNTVFAVADPSNISDISGTKQESVLTIKLRDYTFQSSALMYIKVIAYYKKNDSVASEYIIQGETNKEFTALLYSLTLPIVTIEKTDEVYLKAKLDFNGYKTNKPMTMEFIKTKPFTITTLKKS